MAAAVFSVASLCGCSSDYSTLDWVASVIEKYYYQDVDTSDIHSYTAKEFVSKYLDQYSAFYTAEEYAEVVSSNSGSKSGFGVTYSYLPENGILVSSVIFNSPAYISGLRAGDCIVSATIDGETSSFDSLSEFTECVSALEEGDYVTFNTSEGGEYTMAKSQYTASYVICATNESSWAFLTDGESGGLELTETDADIIEDLPDGAGYICLSQFYGDAASEFAQAVEVLNSLNCDSIIIDLRNNGGGYVSVMQYISACFVSSGENVMTARFKGGDEDVYAADGRYITSDECMVKEDTEVYVLANGNTASASEALIGVLYSYGVIDYSDIYLSDYTDEYISLVGGSAQSLKCGSTYGKGIMQSPYTKSFTGEVLKLTTAQIYWPNGDSIHGVGVTVSDGAKAVSSPYPSNGEGEELSNAINLIYG